MKIRKSRLATLLAVVSFSSIILSGCQFIPPSKEKQYQNIDEFLEGIDYSSAGEIVEEDSQGDGVFSVSVKTALYDDSGAFDTLRERIKKYPSSECSQDFDTKLVCGIKSLKISVSLYRESVNSNFANIRITDSRNGKR